jgi:hypothetical protein
MVVTNGEMIIMVGPFIAGGGGRVKRRQPVGAENRLDYPGLSS